MRDTLIITLMLIVILTFIPVCRATRFVLAFQK